MATFTVGQKVHTRPAYYRWGDGSQHAECWHGVGGVGIVTKIESGQVWVEFARRENGTAHSDWFLPRHLIPVDDDTPLTECSQDAPCQHYH